MAYEYSTPWLPVTRKKGVVHMPWLSCVAQGLHLQQLCIASDRVGRRKCDSNGEGDGEGEGRIRQVRRWWQ